jgi:hypothetical protein
MMNNSESANGQPVNMPMFPRGPEGTPLQLAIRKKIGDKEFNEVKAEYDPKISAWRFSSGLILDDNGNLHIPKKSAIFVSNDDKTEQFNVLDTLQSAVSGERRAHEAYGLAEAAKAETKQAIDRVNSRIDTVKSETKEVVTRDTESTKAKLGQDIKNLAESVRLETKQAIDRVNSRIDAVKSETKGDVSRASEATKADINRDIRNVAESVRLGTKQAIDHAESLAASIKVETKQATDRVSNLAESVKLETKQAIDRAKDEVASRYVKRDELDVKISDYLHANLHKGLAMVSYEPKVTEAWDPDGDKIRDIKGFYRRLGDVVEVYVAFYYRNDGDGEVKIHVSPPRDFAFERFLTSYNVSHGGRLDGEMGPDVLLTINPPRGQAFVSASWAYKAKN